MKKNLFKNLIKIIFKPNINSVLLCRLVLKLQKRNHYYLALLIKNHLLYKYSISLGLNCHIGENLCFPHPHGITIGEGVIIGDNCTIYQNVTLGKKKGNLNNEIDYPIIGDNVTIFTGSVIIGKIYIGNNSIIAANSVVLKDVECNTIYAGIPAKKVKNIK